MKHHLIPSFSTRRALSATTLALLVGATSAVAQSATSSGSTSGTTGASGSGSYNQSSGSTSSDATRRNASGSMGTSGTTTGSSTNSTYGTGSTGSTSTAAGAPTGRDASASDKLSWGDKRFVTKAADGGQAEVQLAQLAAQRASSADVRQFAERLVKDHTAVNTELTGIASAKMVELDKEDAKDRTYKRLSNKSGQDFDREFVEHMIDEHEKDIKMFEKAAKDAKDTEVRSFASKHVGHLREHLQQAQGLQASLVPTGRTDDISSGRAFSTSAGATSDVKSGNSPAPDHSTTPTATGSSTNAERSGTSGSTTGSSSDSRASDRGGAATDPSTRR